MILDDDLTLDHIPFAHITTAVHRRRAQKTATDSGLTIIEHRDGSLGVFENKTAKRLGTLTRYDSPSVTPPPVNLVLWLTCFLAWVAVATIVVLAVRFFFA